MAGDQGTGSSSSGTVGGDAAGAAAGGVVELVVPARAEYVRLVRLAAADLGSRCGFSYDEVDDLRIGVDELCHAVIDGDAGAAGPASLTLRCSLTADAVVIEAACPNRGRPALNDLSGAIVAAVVDEHELHGDGTTARFRMVKRATA